MEIDSISFLPFVCTIFVVHSVLAEEVRKAWIFSVANAAFLWFAVNHKIDLWPLALLVVSGYILARIQVYRQSTWLKLGAVLLITGQFVYFKGYTFLSSFGVPMLPFFAVGMSYLLFRILHLIIDSSENRSFSPSSFIDYFAYVSFFPAFNSGPVQLYPDFQKSMLMPQVVQATAFPSALLRILKGYFKCIVLSKILSTIQQDLYAQSVQDGQAHILLATLACIGFLATLYANFSGYSDVVIGIARLFGISLPENFHKTFSARNFLDIWSGWHMSMSQWFKTYLFNPTVKALATRWPNLALIPWYGVAGYFLTFFIMGVWHGSTLAFCIYGLILGFGASTNKAYQELLKRYVPKKKLNKLRANFWYCAVSRGAAYSYFSLGLACFWLNTQQLGPFVQAFGGWYGIANAFLLATAIFAVVFELFDYVPERLRAVETFTV